MAEFVCLAALGLIAAIGYSIILRLRRRTVPEGYVVRIMRDDKHHRIQHAGRYTLGLSESASEPLLVRQHEENLALSGVLTHGGIPVEVHLAYSVSLDADHMSTDDLYRPDDERRDLQARILQTILRQVVAKAPPPDPELVTNMNIAALFSPFGGAALFDLCDDFQNLAEPALRRHGIIIDTEGCMIQSVAPHPDIEEAYVDLFSRGLEGVSRTDFIRRIRNAAPRMSDAGLVYLYNAINNNPGDARTIFTEGMFTPDLRVRDQDLSIGIRGRAPRAARPAAAPKPPATAASTTTGAAPAAAPTPPAPVPGKSIPGSLTDEDLQLLRPLLEVTV